MAALASSTACTAVIGSSLRATVGSGVYHSFSAALNRNPAALTTSLVSYENGNRATHRAPSLLTVIISFFLFNSPYLYNVVYQLVKTLHNQLISLNIIYQETLLTHCP